MPNTSNFPAALGACLAVNAVSGAALPKGGPEDALYEEARRIHEGHDWAPRSPASMVIAPGPLKGDWLDGYARTLEVLAGTLDLSEGDPHPENVAIVGYLRDRGEGDHQGNLEEFQRLLSALSLRLVSTWLDGGPCAGLESVRDAATLLALPHGRRAARAIARRTGARVIEVGLPFGLAGSERWVRTVGGALGRPEEAQALLTAELGRAAQRLERVLPRLFVGRRVGFIGDPWYLGAFAEFCEELGCKLTLSVATASRRPERESGGGGKVLWEPAVRSRELKSLLAQPLDLLVSSSNEAADAVRQAGGRVLEFGFPSYGSHALSDRPFLGFRGALGFADRMAEAFAGRSGT